MTYVLSLNYVLEIDLKGIRWNDKDVVSGKLAFSKHGGYINPHTKHYARYCMNIPLEYKEDITEDSPIPRQNLDRYYKAVQIDKVILHAKIVKTIKIDGRNGLALDVLVGAKNTILRRKPTIIIEYDLQDKEGIFMFLNETLKLKYKMDIKPYGDVPFVSYIPY